MVASEPRADLGGRQFCRHVGEGHPRDLRPSLTRSPERSANRIFWAKLGRPEMKGAAMLARSLIGLVADAVQRNRSPSQERGIFWESQAKTGSLSARRP